MVLSAVRYSATHMPEPEQSGTRALFDRGANGIKHTPVRAQMWSATDDRKTAVSVDMPLILDLGPLK
jgi:hypothetical protein